MKILKYFFVWLLFSFDLLRSEQLPGMNPASTVKSSPPVKQISQAPITKPVVALNAKPIVAQPETKPVVVNSTPPVAKPIVAQPTAKPVVVTPVAEPVSQVQQVPAVPVTPVKTTPKPVVVNTASFTKLPLQINIKNNAKVTAHVTGFSVVYQGKTVQSNMYLALASSEEKHFTFNLKIANEANQTINYPYVSTILVDGQTVATNYEKSPIGHTLQILQITKKKNGLWALDTKAMKKTENVAPATTPADQSLLRDGIVTTVAQTRAKVVKKTNSKKQKTSKSNQSSKKIVNK